MSTDDTDPWLTFAREVNAAEWEYRERAEQLWRSGDVLTALRYRYLADGLALARDTQLRVAVEARQVPPVGPLAVDAGPTRSIGEVAAEAEADRRRSLERDLLGGAVTEGGQYPGSAVRREHDHAFPVEDFEQHGTQVAQPGTAFDALLTNLQRQRADENAVDIADPDDPRTMRAAAEAVADLVDAPPAEQPSPPAVHPARTYEPPAPRAPQALCGAMTNSGPCILTAGHPVMPVPGTWAGHVSQEMKR